MTTFKVLSHASCQVTHNSHKLLFDPWLIGSCYWRSWWNFPPVEKQTYINLNPSAIYITHFHWDHWHGPTLKKLFSKDTLIITHDEPNKRSFIDLNKIGFKNIKLLRHGESFDVGEIRITPYQFGLFLNDSAVVVQTPDFKLLNANDCKIAGTALRHVIDKHGPFDFALRSHSSANDRVCYSVKNKPEFVNDNPIHYARSFKLFMDAVKPKYAVPFASNHVHLHKDVFNSNSVVNDPFKLKQTLEDLGGLESSLKIMLTGDSWCSVNGFEILKRNLFYFKNKNQSLKDYLNSKQEILDKYYLLESNTKINSRVISEFEKQLNCIPKLFRGKYKNLEYCLHLYSDARDYFFKVKPYICKIKEIDKPDDSLSSIKIPIKVFKDSVFLNMFHHSSISKRNNYIMRNEDDLKAYSAFQTKLELVELGVFPLKMTYIYRLLKSYSLRWREIIVYFKAFFLIQKGVPIYDAEEEILSKT